MSCPACIRGAFRILIWAWLCQGAVQAAPISVEQLLEGERLNGVAISPDGRYLALLRTQNDVEIVTVYDRVARTAKPVLAENTRQGYRPQWCGWANKTRLLCSLRGLEFQRSKYYPLTRLVGVDADGGNLRVLMSSRLSTAGQLQDRVIDWTLNDDDGVLIQLDEDEDIYPAVFRLDVNNGRLRQLVSQQEPIQGFDSDGQGNVRLAWGARDTTQFIYARLDGQEQWKRLVRTQAFSDKDYFDPVGIIPGTNMAYALRDKDGRAALWKIDLSDQVDPELVYARNDAELYDPVFGANGEMLGVPFSTDRPHMYYADVELGEVATAVDRALPNRTNRLRSRTPDKRVFVVYSESDTHAPEFYLAEKRDGRLSLTFVGSSTPGLDRQKLSEMKSLTIPARDGVMLPAYLTMPADAGPQPPPLIVMPHGGPYARDVWGYDEWVQFLASRGYAVLQVNFRGSTGYGTAWFKAGFQDWGGPPYEDVIDATRWAIDSGRVDKQRVCIVGGSYGGYVALSAATRDSSLFRCAVSIAGVSDLLELKRDQFTFVNWRISNLSIGTDNRQLAQKSPINNAARLGIPLLMIHGERDYTVEVDHTRRMAGALRSAGKAFEVVYVPGADHYFLDDADQRTLYTALDAFLARQLAAPAP